MNCNSKFSIELEINTFRLHEIMKNLKRGKVESLKFLSSTTPILHLNEPKRVNLMHDLNLNFFLVLAFVLFLTILKRDSLLVCLMLGCLLGEREEREQKIRAEQLMKSSVINFLRN
jgi:hypothetical protein